MPRPRMLAALALTPLCAALMFAQPKAQPGRTFAFLVGCSAYDNADQWDALPYTVKEMDEFRQVLIDGGVQPEHVKFLRDLPEKPTDLDRRYRPSRRNVLKEFDILLGLMRPEDTLIVAVNGHGIQPKDARTGYFCPADSDRDKLESLIALEGNGGLYELMKAAKPRRKLLLVNACRDDPAKRRPAQAARQVDDYDKGYAFDAPEGIAALFSCRPGQFSFYYPPTDKVKTSPGHERSLFFHHLISAWKGDYGEAGKPVTLEDVFREVGTRTGAEADKLLGNRQNPVVRREYSREWVVGSPSRPSEYDLTGGHRSAHFGPGGAVRMLVRRNDEEAKQFETWIIDEAGAGANAAVRLIKHERSVENAGFSPDGRRVVTASLDKTARVWDAATGRPVGQPMTHEGVVWHACFSPDGRRVVTASQDKTARVWDSATGRPVGEAMAHKDEVRHASFSPDGRRVVTASYDGKTARVWDAATGKPLGEPFKHADPVCHASFSPDGRRVVTASGDKTAHLWDAATGRPVGGPMTHEGWVVHACFSPDGRRVVTASADKTARAWDAATGRLVGGLMTHADTVWHACFSPDGRRVVTASQDKTAHLWDAATGKPVGEAMTHEDWVLHACFSPDGRRVVTASRDGTARVWDAATGKLLGTASVPEPKE